MNTIIELTDEQIAKVLAENTEPPVEPPIEPPVEPPIDPPVDPPPIEPPPSGNLMNLDFYDIWKQDFVPGGYYKNTEFGVTSNNGVSVAIWLPESDRDYRMLVTYVENTSTTVRIEGVLSDRRDFIEPYLDDMTTGTSVEITVPANTDGRYVYANYRPAEPIAIPWRLKLQCVSRY